MKHAIMAIEDVNVTKDKSLFYWTLTMIEAYEGNALHPTILRKTTRIYIQHIFCACISNIYSIFYKETNIYFILQNMPCPSLKM
jgi:hypothetical protein